MVQGLSHHGLSAPCRPFPPADDALCGSDAILESGSSPAVRGNTMGSCKETNVSLIDPRPCGEHAGLVVNGEAPFSQQTGQGLPMGGVGRPIKPTNSGVRQPNDTDAQGRTANIGCPSIGKFTQGRMNGLNFGMNPTAPNPRRRLPPFKRLLQSSTSSFRLYSRATRRSRNRFKFDLDSSLQSALDIAQGITKPNQQSTTEGCQFAHDVRAEKILGISGYETTRNLGRRSQVLDDRSINNRVLRG